MREEIQKIIYSMHPDPFEVLGAHTVKWGGKDALAIRAFLPEADQERPSNGLPGPDPASANQAPGYLGRGAPPRLQPVALITPHALPQPRVFRRRRGRSLATSVTM